jgi:hypothetical protein
MNPLLEKCPVCAERLTIREVECTHCGTRVISDFDIRENLLGVDQDILRFIKVFIYSEGSIKQSEKILNCSYPKIKNLLKKAKAALGITEITSTDSDTAVLERLDRGEITVEAALSMLNA